jgi:hypothetical protein
MTAELDRLSNIESWMRERGVRVAKVGDIQLVLGPMPTQAQRLALTALRHPDEAVREGAKETIAEQRKKLEQEERRQEVRDMVAAGNPDVPEQLIDRILGSDAGETAA